MSQVPWVRESERKQSACTGSAEIYDSAEYDLDDLLDAEFECTSTFRPQRSRPSYKPRSRSQLRRRRRSHDRERLGAYLTSISLSNPAVLLTILDLAVILLKNSTYIRLTVQVIAKRCL